MYNKNTIEKIIEDFIDSQKPVFSISVREIAEQVEKSIGKRPSPSTVKKILNGMGIKAIEGKKRAWVIDE